MQALPAILTVECKEPEGIFQRSIRPMMLTTENLSHLWDKLSNFPTLFNVQIKDVDDFIRALVDMEGGELRARGLVWEVDDVGIVYLTDIYPGFQATGHFTFWDRRFEGRVELLRQMIRYVFESYGFHRLIAEVPLYSKPTLNAAERIGFKREGRMREMAWYRGQWWDVNLYSILEKEALANGNAEARRQQPTAEVASDSSR